MRPRFFALFAIKGLLVSCGGAGDGEEGAATARPEQPDEVVYEDMGYQRGVLLWEGHPYTGLARGLHSDGSVRAEIPLKAGLRHGLVREYYENGSLSMRAEYVEGQRHGERRYFDPDGNLTKVQQWRDDEVVETLEGDELPD